MNEAQEIMNNIVLPQCNFRIISDECAKCSLNQMYSLICTLQDELKVTTEALENIATYENSYEECDYHDIREIAQQVVQQFKDSNK